MELIDLYGRERERKREGGREGEREREREGGRKRRERGKGVSNVIPCTTTCQDTTGQFVSEQCRYTKQSIFT